MISFVYAYYCNHGMLQHQYKVWSGYPDELKKQVRIFIVDDASPDKPAVAVPRPDGLPQIQIYRAVLDQPWHQDGARNLGAHVAPDGWLFLSDMDHVLPASSLKTLISYLDRAPKTNWRPPVYTFTRVTAPSMTLMTDVNGDPKPHPNTYAMTREVYWEAGGYDEDMCGVYGTDAPFRRQLQRVTYICELPVPIIRYPRDVIPDASTTTLMRRGPSNEEARKLAKQTKVERGREGKITVLDFEWVRDL